MKKFFSTLTLFSFIFVSSLFAGNSSPVGKWKTIDDNPPHKVKSIVVIWVDEKGKLRGKIEEIYPDPGEDPNPVCDECDEEDPRYNQPLVGMEIMTGLENDKDEGEGVWIDGEILDPDNGEIYSCDITVDASGKKLEVRGYIGFSFIGRSQTWIRVE